MIIAFSSFVHLLCFLAGDSAACGDILRFPFTTPVKAGPGPTVLRRAGAYNGGPSAGAVVKGAAGAEIGTDEALVW